MTHLFYKHKKQDSINSTLGAIMLMLFFGLPLVIMPWTDAHMQLLNKIAFTIFGLILLSPISFLIPSLLRTLKQK